MLRQFVGLPPLPEKRKIDNKEKNKVYDQTKRKRTIVQSWKTEFSWVICDEIHGEIYCKICRSVYGPLAKKVASDKYKRYANGPFVQGCKNLRHDALTVHESSEGHKYAVDYTKEKNATPGESQADKAIGALNKASLPILDKLFRTSHALAKKSRPISDFIWQCQLDIKKGLDLGQTYLNNTYCKEFMVAISEVERFKIEKMLADARFCTLMSDGSTDVSVIENEVVYVHFAYQGKPHCYFLGMIECESANSNGIYSAIMQALKFKALPKETILQKVVAFAGDGASVNTGHLNGVIAHFRRRIDPSIIMVKCMSHRVELAYKSALQVITFSKIS